jgi:putative endonuclease
VSHTLTIGKSAEEFANLYLQRHGLTLVCRNYRCKYGEIDLIMQDKKTTVFVEVRFRRSHRYGSGAETVDHHKQRKLLATAAHYLQNHNEAAKRPCRFDVLSLTSSPGQNQHTQQPYDVQWIADAIQS